MRPRFADEHVLPTSVFSENVQHLFAVVPIPLLQVELPAGVLELIIVFVCEVVLSNKPCIGDGKGGG